jgi:drug/metabolite transporter (DMT)-like permease
VTSALVLISAFLHALWNALLRLEHDKDRALVAATVFAALFAVVVTGVRWGFGATPVAALAGLGFAALAGVFEAVYFATLGAAMARGTLGTVYTVSRGGAVLVVWPLSAVVFGEEVTRASIAGSALVLAGLAFSGLAARRSEAKGSERAAVAWAVACAVAIAGYHLGYTAALRSGVNPSACFAVALSVAAAINVARLGRGRVALMAVARARWPRLALIGVVCGGSFLLLMEALAVGGSGFVITLRNTSVLFAAGLGWAIGERPTWQQLAGAVLVVAGAAVIAS